MCRGELCWSVMEVGSLFKSLSAPEGDAIAGAKSVKVTRLVFVAAYDPAAGRHGPAD